MGFGGPVADLAIFQAANAVTSAQAKAMTPAGANNCNGQRSTPPILRLKDPFRFVLSCVGPRLSRGLLGVLAAAGIGKLLP